MPDFYYFRCIRCGLWSIREVIYRKNISPKWCFGCECAIRGKR